jgi:hypothetical protein
MPSQRLREDQKLESASGDARGGWGRYQQRRKDDDKNAKKEKAARCISSGLTASRCPLGCREPTLCSVYRT